MIIKLGKGKQNPLFRLIERRELGPLNSSYLNTVLDKINPSLIYSKREKSYFQKANLKAKGQKDAIQCSQKKEEIYLEKGIHS
jgi:hypothetical protein